MRNLSNLLAFVAPVVLAATSVFGQSQVISVESDAQSIKVPSPQSVIPNDLNAEQAKWLAILSRPPAPGFAGEMSCRELILRLREMGLPVILDQSCMEDALPEDEIVFVPGVRIPLFALLQNSIGQTHNATVSISGNQIRLVSKDVANDPEYFVQITYDVGRVQGDVYQIVEAIQSTVDPDGWDVTNGEGTIFPWRNNSTKAISMTQTLDAHLRTQRLLSGLIKLQRSSTMIAGSVNAGKGSRIIKRPSPFAGRSRASSGRGQSGGLGGGVGGYGLGGGVF